MATRPGVCGRIGSLARVRVLVTASMAGTLARGDDLGGQGPLAGDLDQLAAAVADHEAPLVGRLQRSDHVGHLVAAAGRRPPPAHHHPLAHVLRPDADHVAVTHPILPSWALPAPTTVGASHRPTPGASPPWLPTPTPSCGGSPTAWPPSSATCTAPSGRPRPRPGRARRRPGSGPRRPGWPPSATPSCSPRSRRRPWPPTGWPGRAAWPGGPWSRPAWTCWPTRSPRATGPS